MSESNLTPTREGLGAQYRAALKRADSPRAAPDDRAELQRLYDVAPQLWRATGDLARLARNDLIERIPAPFSVKEAIGRKAREIRDELGWAQASQTERLLIEQIVLCWLRMQVQEFAHTATLMDVDGVSLGKAEHQERRLSMVQARYLRAVETLARVRRLLKLTVQINVAAPGAQQVNVAGQVVTNAPDQDES